MFAGLAASVFGALVALSSFHEATPSEVAELRETVRAHGLALLLDSRPLVVEEVADACNQEALEVWTTPEGLVWATCVEPLEPAEREAAEREHE